MISKLQGRGKVRRSNLKRENESVPWRERIINRCGISSELYPNKELLRSPGRREEGRKASWGAYVREWIHDRSLTTWTKKRFFPK